MALSPFSIAHAKPKTKPYSLSDGEGLHLFIYPTGSKLWRLRYRFGGKANMLSLGSFPEIPLIEARKKRGEIREQIAAGINPSLHKRISKQNISSAAQNTFGAIADEYLSKIEKEGVAPGTLKKHRWMLTDLVATLRSRPIDQIKPADILDVLQKVEASGRRDTAHRLRATISRVFRYAVATLRAENDPTYALRGALLKVMTTHRAAITDERELGAFLRSLDEYQGWPVVQSAFEFMILTLARPGDVRGMTRSEVDFEKRLWRVPAARMKMRKSHDVFLSRQAMAILRRMWPLNEEHPLVFPSLRWHKKPLSENAFTSVLRNMGYEKHQACAHGFRSTASTILNERGHDPDVIEAALAHQDSNEVRRIYNRAEYQKERAKLLQTWADLLDRFRGKRAARIAA